MCPKSHTQTPTIKTPKKNIKSKQTQNVGRVEEWERDVFMCVQEILLIFLHI
jgi:hypothetical protein